MNDQNLIPNSERTAKERQEIARKGGIASGEARREKKTLANALRVVLEERVGEGSDLTKREAIVAKVVKRLYDDGDIRDLKILADVLGESVQTIDLKGVAPIVARDAEDAAAMQALLDNIAARKAGSK